MKKSGKKLPRVSPRKSPVLAKENFIPIFENIKDLVESAAKATQTVLKKEMDEKFNVTWAAISEHTRQIKGLDKKIDGVDAKLDDVREELKGEIKTVRVELTNKIEGVRIELKKEMHSMEKRLSDKIDVQSARLDNHDSRITVLEQGT